MPWILVRTKPRRERWTRLHVERLGLPTYSPEYLPKQISARVPRPQPIFANYLFVYLVHLMEWAPLRTTPGVVKVFMTADNMPSIVREEEIAKLRRHTGGDGYVKVPEHRFVVGDEVKIKRGPYADRLGIYQGMDSGDKLRVLYGMMTVVVKDVLVEKAA